MVKIGKRLFPLANIEYIGPGFDSSPHGYFGVIVVSFSSGRKAVINLDTFWESIKDAEKEAAEYCHQLFLDYSK